MTDPTPVPLVNREALANWLHGLYCYGQTVTIGSETCRCRAQAHALFASGGPLGALDQAMREREAAALRDAAEALTENWIKNGSHEGRRGCYSSGYESWLRARADSIARAEDHTTGGEH